MTTSDNPSVNRYLTNKDMDKIDHALAAAPPHRENELKFMDTKDDEAISWITANLQGLRRDDGTMTYTLKDVVHAYQAWPAICALAASPEQKPTVRVKKLEWHPGGYANCELGTYVLYPLYAHAELLIGFGSTLMTSIRRIQLDAGATDEQLKAAAQADYERSILSAIDFQPFDVKTIHPYSRPIVDDEMEILKRLAAGDTIRFSQDGDTAWFTKGDGAFVGNAIISLRSKGYLKRECDDEENYRGTAEYDTISDLGRAALKGGGH